MIPSGDDGTDTDKVESVKSNKATMLEQELLIIELKQTLRDLHLWALTYVVRSYTESVEGKRVYERVQALLDDAQSGGKEKQA